MVHPVEQCLEETLRYWEDLSMERQIFTYTSHKVSGNIPSDTAHLLGMWQDYRATLLDNRIESLDWETWFPQFPELEDLFPKLGTVGTFPLEYFAWTRKSRRIFSIPAPEQEMFCQASMNEIQWGDVLWPFESFGIELATPIEVRTSRGPYLATHLLISHLWFNNDDKMILVRVMDGSGRPSIYNRAERKLLRDALVSNSKSAWSRAAGAYLRPTSDKIRGQGSFGFILHMSTLDGPDTPVMLDEKGIQMRGEQTVQSPFNNVLRILPEGAKEALGKLGRIVVGTCLYLDSLMSTSSPPTWSIRKKMGRQYVGPLGIITDEALVCRIVGRSVIDPARYDSSDLELDGQGFVRPHWRRRHRRRPAFTPPHHPKTIIVPPRLINKGLIPMFGILAGSITRMLSAEEEFK